MKAEIIAVGTELLLGQIVNTNAQYLSQGCAELGIDVYYQTVVGDNELRLKQALSIARDRADLIICTGGLGPTQDDITKDVLSAFLGYPLEMHEPSMEKITNLFESRGLPMVESNARQALVLSGCDPLFNDTGLAVGVGLTHEGVHYILLPGPPKEMKPMFDHRAKPWLLSMMKEEQPLFSIMMKFAGIGESSLEHTLIDLIKSQEDPTIAPYAKEGEVTIRLSTKASTYEEAASKMEATRVEIHQRLGSFIYAEEDVTLESVIVRMMNDRKLTLSAAESCTGGHFGDMITSIPGSSGMFTGGFICYSNELKHKLLHIPMNVLEGDDAPGAVSPETAELMAANVLQQTGSDLAIGITGVAGPSSSERKPVGLVYIAIAEKGHSVVVEQHQISGNREMIKHKAAKSALLHLWNRLK